VGSLIVIVILAVVLWIFIVVPSRRRQRQHAAMQDSVGVGDDVITAGGLHGTVRELGEEDLRLEIAPGLLVTLDRRAVAAVARDVEEEDEGEDAEGAGEDDAGDDAHERPAAIAQEDQIGDPAPEDRSQAS
jgi:preprotein translocase subunit YajC